MKNQTSYLIETTSITMYIFMFLTCVCCVCYYIEKAPFLSVSFLFIGFLLGALGIKFLKEYKANN